MDFGFEKLIISEVPDICMPSWDVVNVRPLYAGEKFLGYAGTYVFPDEIDENGEFNFDSCFPEQIFELPREFFNHEFRNLLIHRSEPEFVSKFMSKFGFIHCLKERRCEAEWPKNNAEYRAMKKLIGEDMLLNYKQYGDFYIPCDMFISEANFQHTLSLISACIAFLSMLAEGTYCVDDIEYGLIEKLDVQTLQDNYFEYEVYNEDRYQIIDLLCTIINEQLRIIAPEIGFVNSIEPIVSFGDGDHEQEGSLISAIFIQLYQFAVKGMKDGFKRCQECGNIFATRRTKGASSSRSTAKFCCEKCRDRFRKRELRRQVKNGS